MLLLPLLLPLLLLLCDGNGIYQDCMDCME